MSLREIPMHLKYADKFAKITTDINELRRISYQVDTANEEAIKECRRLAAVMEAILLIDPAKGAERHNIIGYGLSARQLKELDGKESPRLSVVILPNTVTKNGAVVPGAVYNMLNPQIVKYQDSWRYKGEGCLSFPEVYHNTKRYYSIRVGFLDVFTMLPREIDFFGVEAVVMQHEIDHQDGKVFLDHALIPAVAGVKIGPNDPCECGSGKKAKKCCGV